MRALAAAFALLVATSVLALPADRSIAQYVRRAWTVENGLPHGTVRGFAQTRDGYLWLATYEGLVRFNGEKFRILDKSTDPSIVSTSIVTIARAADDTLWLGTLAGLMRYRNGQLETIQLPGEQEIVNAVAPAQDGTVWIGTARGRLLRVRDRKAEVVPLPINHPIATLATDGDALWIGTAQGLARYRAGKLERWTAADGLSSDTIVMLAVEAPGTLLAGTAQGLDRFDGKRFTRVDGLPADQVTALRRDHDGNLWIGTYSSGLFRLAGHEIAAYGLSDGLLNPTVRAIYEDDEGSLWVGTNGGFEQLRAGAFVHWGEQDGLADAVARVVFEDRDGALWVGSANGVSRSANGNVFTRYLNEHLTGILAIAQSRDGAMWFGTSNGVYRVADGVTTPFTMRNGLSNNTIRAIHQDRAGDIWIGTDFGLNRIRENGTIESFAGRAGLSTDYAMAIAESPDGHLWIATGGGLAHYDGNAFHLYSAPHAFPTDRLLALTADNDGTIWVATDGNGLVRFRNGKARAITTRHGLPADKILSLVDDGQGMLWFGTVRGAFRAAKRDLNAAADGRVAHLDAPLFDENDGLGSRQCNGVANPAALRTHDGRIWFATANGVSALAAAPDLRLPQRAPVIERVMVNGKPIAAKNLSKVPPGAERIEFEFSGVTFVTPERVHFRYRVDGYDNDWLDAESDRVSYTNLRAGSYRFLLASSRDGVTWRETAVPFTLRPHFYQTTTFLALCIIAVVALLFAAHTMRLHFTRERARLLERTVEERTRQISEEKERTEIALRTAEAARREAEAARREAERHERITEQALAQAEEASRAKSTFLAAASHELRTPLNAIIGFSEILIPHVTKKLEPRLTGFLHNIHSSGVYLLGIINNILDLSKIEAGRMEIHPETMLLRDEVGGICAVMKGVTTLRGIRFEVEVPKELAIEADVTLLKQILYNLMSNAVKFSPDRSTVTIAAQAVDATESPLRVQSVEIRVIDRGVGIDPKDHQMIFQEFRQAEGAAGNRPQGTGLGLALVRRFVDLHRGAIRVESEPGAGSTFTVTLPMRQSGSGERERVA
ncbi:MAG TPA: two-component regulator propeller domain-containing protein [Thermoanaerobaculia bacterium]|nr:two-component regulator propeller domain-containing protein [Thermoanaerobaculia bacterium]